jgi:hypothetical protein
METEKMSKPDLKKILEDEAKKLQEQGQAQQPKENTEYVTPRYALEYRPAGFGQETKQRRNPTNKRMNQAQIKRPKRRVH